MPLTLSPCVPIPCRNHGTMVSDALGRLRPFNPPCIVVDDSNDEATRDELIRLTAEYSNLTLIRLPINANRGAAVIRGVQTMTDVGFSHAVQVDTDEQHAIEDIPRPPTLAEEYPITLTPGQPIYDNSVPRSRLYDRWVAHIWVWIETLSLQPRDSMCGFQVYPVTPTLQLV